MIKKPEITEHSCIKAMELMVKWEAYFKHEMDKKDAEIASLVQEGNSAFKQGNYEGYKDGFENGQNDERGN